MIRLGDIIAHQHQHWVGQEKNKLGEPPCISKVTVPGLLYGDIREPIDLTASNKLM